MDNYYISDAGVLVHNKCYNPQVEGMVEKLTERRFLKKAELEAKGWSVRDPEKRVQLKGGLPVARERRAKVDLESTGVETIFIAYN